MTMRARRCDRSHDPTVTVTMDAIDPIDSSIDRSIVPRARRDPITIRSERSIDRTPRPIVVDRPPRPRARGFTTDARTTLDYDDGSPLR